MERLHDEVTLHQMMREAYACNDTNASGIRYARDFERGWKQAYYNVSKGADPCPPSVPPKPYWALKYQNAEGCNQIAAWYDGYRSGATAAQQGGRQLYNTLPVNDLCMREDAQACQPTGNPVFGNGNASEPCTTCQDFDVSLVEPPREAGTQAVQVARLPGVTQPVLKSSVKTLVQFPKRELGVPVSSSPANSVITTGDENVLDQQQDVASRQRTLKVSSNWPTKFGSLRQVSAEELKPRPTGAYLKADSATPKLELQGADVREGMHFPKDGMIRPVQHEQASDPDSVTADEPADAAIRHESVVRHVPQTIRNDFYEIQFKAASLADKTSPATKAGVVKHVSQPIPDDFYAVAREQVSGTGKALSKASTFAMQDASRPSLLSTPSEPASRPQQTSPFAKGVVIKPFLQPAEEDQLHFRSMGKSQPLPRGLLINNLVKQDKVDLRQPAKRKLYESKPIQPMQMAKTAADVQRTPVPEDQTRVANLPTLRQPQRGVKRRVSRSVKETRPTKRNPSDAKARALVEQAVPRKVALRRPLPRYPNTRANLKNALSSKDRRPIHRDTLVREGENRRSTSSKTGRATKAKPRVRPQKAAATSLAKQPVVQPQLVDLSTIEAYLKTKSAAPVARAERRSKDGSLSATQPRRVVSAGAPKERVALPNMPRPPRVVPKYDYQLQRVSPSRDAQTPVAVPHVARRLFRLPEVADETRK